MSTPREIEAGIEQQREELAETVEALADRLDVPARAKERVADARDEVMARPGATVTALVTALAVVGALVWWRRR